MGEIDFVTAFGRLLHDVRLRDAFRKDRARTVERLNVRATDRETIERLAPEELEFQARTLLKKRLNAIQRRLPTMCERLGERLWTTFVDYSGEASSQGDPTEDACWFAEYVATTVPAAKCSSEVNRWQFAAGRARFCMRFTSDGGTSMFGGRALQFFVRWRNDKWREWRVGFRSYNQSSL